MIFIINLNFKLLTNIKNQELSQKKIIGKIAHIKKIFKKIGYKTNFFENLFKKEIFIKTKYYGKFFSNCHKKSLICLQNKKCL